VKEREIGIFLLLIWTAVTVFYLTWDGWVQEWEILGYSGPNQHFDFDLFDMRYIRTEDGGYIYISTNNLHNLMYICYFILFMAWAGFLFNWEWAKQGLMATIGIPFIASIVMLEKFEDSANVMMIVYHILHLSSVVPGLYLLSERKLSLRRSIPGTLGTWFFYVLSRVILEPFPYWKGERDAYYSLNQINDMPFYFYGLEYGTVILILLGVNFTITVYNLKIKSKVWRILLPIFNYMVVYIILRSLGLISFPTVDTRTWMNG